MAHYTTKSSCRHCGYHSYKYEEMLKGGVWEVRELVYSCGQNEICPPRTRAPPSRGVGPSRLVSGVRELGGGGSLTSPTSREGFFPHDWWRWVGSGRVFEELIYIDTNTHQYKINDFKWYDDSMQA